MNSRTSSVEEVYSFNSNGSPRQRIPEDCNPINCSLGKCHIEEWPRHHLRENKDDRGDKYYEKLCAVEQIGQGGFGKIYLGHKYIQTQEEGIQTTQRKKCTEKLLAIKVCNSRKEFDVQKKLKDNPYIVTPIKCFKTKKDEYVPELGKIVKEYVIAMEYCSNGDLVTFFQDPRNEQKIGCPKTAGTIVKHIVEGLKALDGIGYFHRDIKANNVFVDSSKNFKLGDFGLVASKDEINIIQCGIPTAMAPEMDGKYPPYDNKVDVWSLGILFYKLLYGLASHPFDPKNDKSESEIVKQIRSTSPETSFDFQSINNSRYLIV